MTWPPSAFYIFCYHYGYHNSIDLILLNIVYLIYFLPFRYASVTKQSRFLGVELPMVQVKLGELMGEVSTYCVYFASVVSVGCNSIVI